MTELFILIRYDYLYTKDVYEIMGFFKSREDVNIWKRSQTFKGEYKMKTIEYNIDKTDLEHYEKLGLLGLSPGFKHRYDVL